MKSSLRVIGFIFCIQLFIFGFITLRPFYITPADHTYTILSKNYLFPIFYYPSMILQSKNGAWSMLDTHTTAPTNRVHAQWFFIVAGKLAALFHIEPAYIFIFLQGIGGVLVFISIYLLITRLLPEKYHSIALILGTIIEVSPRIDTLNLTGALIPSFDGQTLMFRAFGLPHHAWGVAFGIFSIVMLLMSYEKPTVKRLTALFVSSLFSTIFLPSFMVTIGLSIYPACILWALATKTMKKLLAPLTVAVFAIGLVGLQTKIEFANAGYPWNSWSAIEKTWWVSQQVLMQYFYSMAIYLPFLILFLVEAVLHWKHWSNKLRLTSTLMSAWILIPIPLILISNESFFPIANMRLIEGTHYLACGMLSTIGLLECITHLRTIALKQIVLSISLAIILGVSIFVHATYLSNFLKTQEVQNPIAYPLTTTWNGVQFLKTIPRESGVLARESFGELLPGFADIRVYIGGQHGFPDWLDRQSQAYQFFTGTWNEEDARNFLVTHDIQYVFYGPDEQAATSKSPLYPTILQEVYKNSSVIIFKLR
jgi:hypothetical protein